MKSKVLLRITAVLAASAILATVPVACGQKNSADVQKQQTQAAPTDSAKKEVKDREPYEFTFYMNYPGADASLKFGEDKVSAELKNKFNVTMKLQKPESDPAMKLNVMLASDDLPEVLWMDRDPNYLKFISMGKFIALDDYIAKYPNYKKVVSPEALSYSKVNGKTYAILNWPTDPNKLTGGNMGWMINEKIHKDMGSPKLDTLEDLYNYAKAIRDKNLMVNGKTVIPIQFQVANPGEGAIDIIRASFGRKAPLAEYIYPENNELKLYYKDPKFEGAALFVNKLWRENLINKDYFVEKIEQVREKLASGRVAVYGGGNTPGMGESMRLRLKEIDPQNDYKVIAPPAAPGVAQKDVAGTGNYALGANVICITSKAKKPERIFEYFDYVISNEGQRLVFYGPSGFMYDEVDSNGYPVLKKSHSQLTEDEKKTYGIGKWVFPGEAVYVDHSKYAADERKPADQRDWTIQAQKNIFSKHKWKADEFMNLFTDPKTEEGIAFTAFKDLNQKMLPKIIMAESEEQCKQQIKAAVQDAYKVGFEKVEKYKTQKWQENLKILSK